MRRIHTHRCSHTRVHRGGEIEELAIGIIYTVRTAYVIYEANGEREEESRD